MNKVKLGLNLKTDVKSKTLEKLIDPKFIWKGYVLEYVALLINSIVATCLIIFGLLILFFQFPTESLEIIKITSKNFSFECYDRGIFCVGIGCLILIKTKKPDFDLTIKEKD